MPPGVVLIQLGCEKNVIDGERLLGELDAGGYKLYTCPPPHRAEGKDLIFQSNDSEARDDIDLMVVNTCSFIGPAREESIDAILAAADWKRSGRVSRLAVSGCFTQIIHDQLTDELRNEIDYFIPSGDLDRTLEILAGEEPFFRPAARSLEAGPRILSRSNGTAYVKIAEGCNKTCAFCTIPSFKGRFVSKSAEATVEEIRALLAVGVREAVLVSQDTASWGVDLNPRSTLAELISEIDRLAGPEHEFRLRIHYLYPTQVDADLLDAFARSPVTVPYFDIPVQHASEKVLRAMRRPPLPGRMIELVDEIRRRFDESAIRTTVIAGHPGETREEFRKLTRFLERVCFDRVGVFAYSPEPGTAAYKLRTPPRPDERAREIMALQETISLDRQRARIGRTYRVLMDSPRSGRTDFEAPDIDGIVHVEGRTGTFQNVAITGADAHDLVGTIV